MRYAQVAFTGDCWFIMRDGKSVGDTVRSNETDFQARVRNLLRQAGKTNGSRLRERVLFALAYGELYGEEQLWYEEEWSDKLLKYVTKARPNTAQYRAFAALANFEKNNTESGYVSRCDEFRQFKKQWK